MSSLNNIYVGYVTSRPFGSFTMPVPAQNLCIRDFVNKNKGIYIPPQLEHKFENCLMQFYGTLNKLQYNYTLVMYSFDILYDFLYKCEDDLFLAFDFKKIKISFVLENTTISNSAELKIIKFNKSLSRYIMKDEYFLDVYNSYNVRLQFFASDG